MYGNFLIGYGLLWRLNFSLEGRVPIIRSLNMAWQLLFLLLGAIIKEYRVTFKNE